MESESESFERISILDKRDLLRSDRVPRKGHIGDCEKKSVNKILL